MKFTPIVISYHAVTSINFGDKCIIIHDSVITFFNNGVIIILQVWITGFLIGCYR